MNQTSRIDVSIIIPTYHRENLVIEAIKSVFAQTQVTVEIIVVDDSPEGSARKNVEGLEDTRITYFKRVIPSGGIPALVRNDGWKLAKGKYVHFLDDDDKLYPGALNALVTTLEKHRSKGVAFGKVIPFGEDAKVLKHEQEFFTDASKRARHLYNRPMLVACLLFYSTVLVNSTCLIRRECLQPLEGYDSSIPLWEDVEFFMRAIRKFGGIYVDKPILYYRTGETSLSSNLEDSEKLIISYNKSYEKYRKDHGLVEFMFLKIFARTVFKLPMFH